MKTLRFFGMALVAVVLSVGFCACSDDDDDSGSLSSLEKTLSGTTWKVTDIDYYDGFWVGELITFNKDHTFKTVPDWNEDEDDDDPDYKLGLTWGEKDDYLVLAYNYDDYMVGTFVISGSTATYTWKWVDYHTGTWKTPWDLSNGKVVKLQKQ